MSLWNQYRLIDIMSNIDMALVEEDFPEGDLDNLELFPKKKNKWNKRKVAVLSGLAASSIALTGVVVIVVKRHDVFRRAA